MMEKLQNGPMAIAVAAGNRCWRFYESGVLTSSHECPTDVDHAVVIVGLVLEEEIEEELEKVCRKST